MSELVDLFHHGTRLDMTVARVVSLQDRTVSVTRGADTITGVAIAAHVTVKPGDLVTVLTNGRQHLIIASPAVHSGYKRLSLASGFGNPDWAFPASYRLEGDRVHLAGVIAKTGGNMQTGVTEVATAPPEIRPPAGYNATMPASCTHTGSTTAWLARLDINADGRVQARIGYANANWIGLDGLSYRIR